MLHLLPTELPAASPGQSPASQLGCAGGPTRHTLAAIWQESTHHAANIASHSSKVRPGWRERGRRRRLPSAGTGRHRPAQARAWAGSKCFVCHFCARGSRSEPSPQRHAVECWKPGVPWPGAWADPLGAGSNFSSLNFLLPRSIVGLCAWQSPCSFAAAGSGPSRQRSLGRLCLCNPILQPWTLTLPAASPWAGQGDK